MAYGDNARSRQRSVRLSESVIFSIEKLAIEQNRTFNNMVETILLNEARQHKLL